MARLASAAEGAGQGGATSSDTAATGMATSASAASSLGRLADACSSGLPAAAAVAAASLLLKPCFPLVGLTTTAWTVVKGVSTHESMTRKEPAQYRQTAAAG